VNTGLRISAFLVKNRTYSSFEPRLSGRYLLTDSWALKFDSGNKNIKNKCRKTKSEIRKMGPKVNIF
jgi:hypothetical protein